jgi:hypothetical protein
MRIFERIANVNNHTAPPLFRLATRPHHVFGEVIWMAPSVSATGHEQHEKICIHCGAVKVTVIPERGDPWREWRAKGAVTQSRWPIVCEVAAT